MNRRDFFRTLFGTLAALPIARLFGWSDPPMVDEALSWSDMIKAAMVSSLTDWDSGYVEVEHFTELRKLLTTNALQGSWAVASVAPFDRLGVNPEILWSTIDVTPGLTWTELDTTD